MSRLVWLLILFHSTSSFLLLGKHRITDTACYYDYFKKNKDGEKKDIKRLWKNIIFPGIYFEYADTKEPIKTVKVETKQETKAVRNAANEQTTLFTSGTYNVADERSVPQYTSNTITTNRKMKPIQRPANFVSPVPKKSLTVAPGKGVTVLPNIQSYKRPKQPIILYDYESDSECKQVRLACSMLDLTVEFRPCPGALYGFSDQMSTLTLGERKVPYMIDNNPSMYRPRLFGARDIIEHLFDTYGPGADAIPAILLTSKQTPGFFSNTRKGSRLRPNARLDNNISIRALTLYGWEGAPFVTPVRELLNELSIPHVLVNCAAGSAYRDKLTARTKGVFQVPYLADPNTGIEMFESAVILKYLEDVYTI